jgi:hypothetical protein
MASFQRKMGPTLKELDRVRAMILALPVKFISRTIPWGYRVSDNDPDMLEPIEEHMRLLYQAKKYLATCSVTEVSSWLSQNSKVYISDEGLCKLMSRRPPDKAVLLPLEERQRIYRYGDQASDTEEE